MEYPCPGEYEIQIARDSEFADLVDSDKVPALANYYVPAIELSAGSYYWRVRYLNEAGLVAPWSESSAFQVRALEGNDVVHVSAGASWENVAAAYGKALARASRKPPGASGVELRFENAVYKLQQTAEGQALFETPAGMGGVVINGRGATFILKARTSGTGRQWQVCGFLYADGPDTSAIQVRNCIVDYHPESQRTVAARIVGLDRKAGTFTAELLPEYAAALPQIGHVKAGVFLAGETFQRSLVGTRAHTEQDWPHSNPG